MRGIAFSIACAGGLAALFGCSQAVELAPAPRSETVPGHPDVAEAANAGVRVTVGGSAWKGPTLDQRLTPVSVTLENHSGHALRIRYDDFSIGGSNGFQRAALPPLEAAQTATPPTAMAPEFGWGGFYVAPWYAANYPTIPPWTGPLDFQAGYYDTYRIDWPQEYRSQAVLDKAIPEGVLEDGGHLTGFIFFGNLDGHSADVTFKANLVDANSNKKMASVDIPFVLVRHGKPIASAATNPG